jgi:hypothetical protein
MKRIVTFLFAILSFCFLLTRPVHAQSILPPVYFCFFPTLPSGQNPSEQCLSFVGKSDSNLYQIVVDPADAGGYSLFQKIPAPAIAPGSSVVGYHDNIYGIPWVYYLTKESTGTFITALEGQGGEFFVQSSYAGPVLAESTLQAYTNDPDYEDDLIYIGTDHHVHQFSWTPNYYPTSTPELEDVTALAGAGDVSGGVISSQIVFATPTFWQQVMYVGTDNHIHELYRWVAQNTSFPPPQTWYKNDLTLLTGAELAENGSPIATFYDSIANLSAVFYIGKDKHVHELYFLMSADVWQTLDVTSMTGAPIPRTDSPLAAGAGTDEGVFYFDASGDVRELWSSPTLPTSWNTPANTINYEVGGATSADAKSPLVGSSTELSGINELFYIGTDHAIHQFFQDGPWYATDITAASGAPKARN